MRTLPDRAFSIFVRPPIGRLGRAGMRWLASLALGLAPCLAMAAPILSFVVGPDEALTYPSDTAHPPYLVSFPDEHTTFIPMGNGSSGYLVFAASRISGGTGGAVVLQTTDLVNFQFATALGYAPQVMAPAIGIGQCNPTYDTEFDEGYAAPGTVLQDPTLPAGNLIMLYEAENHCPGGVNQFPYYATVGFARSADNGKTWPAPVNSVLGDATRHPVLTGPNAQPSTPYPAMGDAIPSAIVETNSLNESYLYVIYTYHSGGFQPASDGLVRVARAKLGADPLVFQKWFNGSFSQPGIGGLDSSVLSVTGCSGGFQENAEITYNDDLKRYLMVYVCLVGPATSRVGAWYYATATSLALQDWSAPQMIQNSQFAVTVPCPGGSANGSDFDGWYPSFMSPGAAAGHTKLTGKAFFLSGCNAGTRRFASRTFTINVIAPSNATADCLFNWAERNYVSLFSPAASSQMLDPYYYRYYSGTRAYLGVSASDAHAYYLSGGVLTDAGPASYWYGLSGCQ